VNGKALVSGLDLKTMNAADMVDVLHYFFEEDSHYLSEIQSDTRSNLRTSLYKTMYNTTYKYAVSRQPDRSRNFDSDDFDTDLDPFGDDIKETKPYVPPTNFNPDSTNPFNGLLDAPL
jgi:hypothetical protein